MPKQHARHEAVAMTFRGREVTYEQLVQRVDDMAIRLAGTEVGPAVR